MTFNRYAYTNVRKRVEANRQRVADASPSLIASPDAMQARERTATALLQLWRSLIPEGTPDLTQFFDWFDRFGSTIVERAIRRCAQKARQRKFEGDPMTGDDAARYCASTCRCMAETR